MGKVIISLCVAVLLPLAIPAFADYSTSFEPVEGYSTGTGGAPTTPATGTSPYLYDQPSELGWATSDTTDQSWQVWAGDPTIYPEYGKILGRNTPGTATGLASAYDGTWALNWKASYGRSAYHSIGGTYNHTRVDVRMQHDENGVSTSYFWATLQAGTSATDRSTGFGFKYNQLGYYTTGTSWVNVGAFEPNRWYHFVADVDMVARTYSLWIDDVLVAQNVGSYSATCTPSNTVYFYRNGYVDTAVDALSVTQVVPEPSSLLALIFGAAGLLGYTRRRK